MALHTYVNATDLRQWAEREHPQRILPRLVRRLIHATVGRIQRIGFPADEGVQMAGWDGVLEVPEGNAFVPDGLSVWEMGKEQNPKGKADSDYEKRTRAPGDVEPAEAAFVFVTPRYWKAKRKWAAEKQAEGIWREVRAYDAQDLEEWLETAPAVHLWFSKLLGKHPEGVNDLSSFWAAWPHSTKPAFSPELVVGGREDAAGQIYSWLGAPASLLTLQTDTTDEALAFAAAAINQLSAEERVGYLARAVIVSCEADWQHLVGSGQPLILIPTFDVRGSAAIAVQADHHVLAPLGRTDVAPPGALILPRLNREAAQQAFEQLGVPGRRAAKLAVLARRSLTATRRRLAVVPELKGPHWASPAEARSLVPALFASAWTDASDGDREALSSLGTESYDAFRSVLLRWVNEPDAPVKGTGDVWLLVSTEDAWALLARYVTRDDLDRFESTALEVLSQIDPALDLPPERRIVAGLLGKVLRHSPRLREGLAETLAYIGARSDALVFADASSGQGRASRIVRCLLDRANEDWRLWCSLSAFLPLLAEAAPDEFLEAVDRGLSGREPVLARLFTEEGDPLFGSSPHTGLLWALEGIAWSPAHLGQACLQLAALARLDPGGCLSNRPANSLREIFLSWYPQTSATLAQRLRVLDTLRKREPEVAWPLLCALLPELHSTSLLTHAPRWRDWASDEPCVAPGELCTTVEEVLNRLLEDVGNDPGRCTDLVERIGELYRDLVDRVVDRLESLPAHDMMPDGRARVRNALRELTVRHRRFPDADWSLPANLLERLERVAQALAPEEPIPRHAWLFSHHAPRQVECDDDWELRRTEVEEQRSQAAGEIYSVGLDSAFEAARQVEEPGILGCALGRKLAVDDERRVIREVVSEGALHKFACGYIWGRFYAAAWGWADAQLHALRHGEAPELQAAFLRALPFESETWQRVGHGGTEVQRYYWSNVRPSYVSPEDCEEAPIRLSDAGRPFSAIDLLALHVQDGAAAVPATRIAEILESALKETPSDDLEPGRLAHEITELLEVLDRSDEIDPGRLARLEWVFLPLLGSYGRGPKVLHAELSRDPVFFSEVVNAAYRGDDEEPQELSEQEQVRAKYNWELLDTWKSIPGAAADGGVDGAFLAAWVQGARELAVASGRGSVADHVIGRALAFSPPDTDDAWPHRAVRDLLEELGSREIERGIEVGVYNRRGATWRSLTDGGAQERELAQKYSAYAASVSDLWPRTAAMLRRISAEYEENARREDISAELRQDFLT